MIHSRIHHYVIGLLLALLFPLIAWAEIQESVPIAGETRIRTYVYDPNTVFGYTGYYRFQSSIEFENDESIATITMGDSTGWMIQAATNRLFLKPIGQEANTNMTIYTNKRIYLFEMNAEEASDIRDEGLGFIYRFVYPNSSTTQDALINVVEEELPDLERDAEKYNFNYSMTGSRLISPLKIFDDGEFTYFQFKDVNAEVPAIFQVDQDGFESLINHRVTGPYIVVERVAQQLTLRLGKNVACIFNEADPFEKRPEPKKKFLGIF